MSGLDEIINIILSQRMDNEVQIIRSAEKKAREIRAEAEENAERAYGDYMKKAEDALERDYENACSSVDASMKREILRCKVEMIDSVIERTISRLKKLPDGEYFELLERLIKRHLRSGEGILFLGRDDLKRVPKDFADKINISAREKNGSVKFSENPADISDGFVLQYGLVSENCSFHAIIESEKDGVRDTAAKILFG